MSQSGLVKEKVTQNHPSQPPLRRDRRWLRDRSCALHAWATSGLKARHMSDTEVQPGAADSGCLTKHTLALPGVSDAHGPPRCSHTLRRQQRSSAAARTLKSCSTELAGPFSPIAKVAVCRLRAVLAASIRRRTWTVGRVHRCNVFPRSPV